MDRREYHSYQWGTVLRTMHTDPTAVEGVEGCGVGDGEGGTNTVGGWETDALDRVVHTNQSRIVGVTGARVGGGAQKLVAHQPVRTVLLARTGKTTVAAVGAKVGEGEG
uniref:Uncharacterized protein n=1 Tax=Lygus hesperus TaxID=30085 RepID=A0A146M3V3_LYGHE